MKRWYWRVSSRIKRIVAGKWFFYGVLALFAVHTLWLVFSSNLLPFDEYYHVGIIDFYAKQWSPIITWQPPEMSVYGDVTRLSAYLYHYLMSFPYRFVGLFTDSQTIQIIVLRIMNLGMVVTGIVLFRKLFRLAKISDGISNVATLVFVMTPIVPLLSAQNNYDNAMFMLTPLVLLYALKSIQKPLKATNLIWLVTLGMVATLIKFNFIVIFGAVVGFVLLSLFVQYKLKLWVKLKKSFKPGGRVLVVALAASGVVTLLFAERVGYNVIKYHEVKVSCDSVQSVEVCEQYSPWRRNKNALADKTGELPYGGVTGFSVHWVKTITKGYFAVFANIIPDNLNKPDPYGHYEFAGLARSSYFVGRILLAAGLLALLVALPQLLKNSQFNRLILLSFAGLVMSLWVFNFAFYLKYERAYAIQARYILPLVLPMLVVMGQAIRIVSAKKRMGWLASVMGILIVAYCLWGGSTVWVARSRDNWYWPSQQVRDFNNLVQEYLEPITP
ncbi:hypothetical protein KC973_00820 [Candidatus Saccharibacteria bacterium]|nr:hypothetical protein [Candidatus Saccharibacteria bacterium]